MTTIWKSTKKADNNNTSSATLLSSWSRQQKLAVVASCAILGLLLAVSACSKQSSKTATASAPGPIPPVTTPTTMASTTSAIQSVSDLPIAMPTKAAKKVQRKRSANVTYSDPNSGVSFVYPRKFTLASGDKALPQFVDRQARTMNFVQPGGVTIASVAVPNTLYPQTDFASGFFTVNVNRSLSEQECSHFSFVDMSDADGEPIDALKVKVGPDDAAKDMEMTSEYTGTALYQSEAQYYHSYENGACYEYVLGLGTAGYGAKDGIEPINREAVFARLEKILATVKTQPVAPATEVKEVKTEEKSADGETTR